MRRLAPLVADWVERMGSPAPAGDFPPDDAIPETLLPLLKRQMAEQGVELAGAVDLFREWTAANPSGARAPRSFGEHDFRIGGRRGVRQVQSVSLWRLQRVLDHLNAMDAPARARAEALLDRIGGRGLAATAMPRRFERRDYRLFAM